MAFKLVAAYERLTYARLAASMHLSAFEAHSAVQRLMAVGLAMEIDGVVRISKAAFKDLVLHGANYVYPAVRTEVTVGFPTAYAAAPLQSQLGYALDMPPIWAHPEGTTRGVGVLPLYPKLPLAALQDAALYERLALFDALRMGQARERKLVSELLAERLT